MRLVLPLAPDLPRRELDAGHSLVVLRGTAERPLVTLLLHHPHIPRMSMIEYANAMSRVELPEGTTEEVKATRGEPNKHGWQMRVARSEIVLAGSDVAIESRLTAIFRFHTFQTFAASAIARVFDPARFAEVEPVIEKLFHEARPDWNGGEAPSLAQLYE